MFTLEIEGKAVAVINGDEETARDLFTCDGFKEDIQKMTSDGAPLWNGTSELKIRAASEDEIEIFEDALAEDDGEGDFEDDPRHAANDAHHRRGRGTKRTRRTSSSSSTSTRPTPSIREGFRRAGIVAGAPALPFLRASRSQLPQAEPPLPPSPVAQEGKAAIGNRTAYSEIHAATPSADRKSSSALTRAAGSAEAAMVASAWPGPSSSTVVAPYSRPGIQAGRPVDGVRDLKAELVEAALRVEHGGPVEPADEARPRAQRLVQGGGPQPFAEPDGGIRETGRVRRRSHREHDRALCPGCERIAAESLQIGDGPADDGAVRRIPDREVASVPGRHRRDPRLRQAADAGEPVPHAGSRVHGLGAGGGERQHRFDRKPSGAAPGGEVADAVAGDDPAGRRGF